MYDHILYCGRKHFCHYCVQAFSTAKKIKSHVNDCFKINGKNWLRCLKKVKMLRLKIKKIKLPFMIMKILKVF